MSQHLRISSDVLCVKIALYFCGHQANAVYDGLHIGNASAVRVNHNKT